MLAFKKIQEEEYKTKRKMKRIEKANNRLHLELLKKS